MSDDQRTGVHREFLTNPTEAETVDVNLGDRLDKETPERIRRAQVTETSPAAGDKELHERLPGLSDDELGRLPVLEPGTPLEQGSVYLDLDDLGRGPFMAIGGQEAGARVVPKKDAAYELWNRLAGRDDEPEVERPAGQG